MYVRVMKVGAAESVAALRAAFDAFAACEFESLTRAELPAVMDEYETLTCRLPSQTQRMPAQLQAETFDGGAGTRGP